MTQHPGVPNWLSMQNGPGKVLHLWKWQENNIESGMRFTSYLLKTIKKGKWQRNEMHCIVQGHKRELKINIQGGYTTYIQISWI